MIWNSRRGLALVSLAAAVAFAPVLASAKNLRIENKRDVALTELTIIAKEGEAQRSFLLAKNIDAGKVVTGKVPAQGCLFDVKGTFADNATLAATDMNLCAHRTIRLVK